MHPSTWLCFLLVANCIIGLPPVLPAVQNSRKPHNRSTNFVKWQWKWLANASTTTSFGSVKSTRHDMTPSIALAQARKLASSQDAGAFDLDARIRQHWQELTRICPQQNYSSCAEANRSGWTDASRTEFSDFKFAGLEAWSKFKLITYNSQGIRQSKGGDSWHVTLRDRLQHIKQAVRVFDEGDGTYLAAVYFLLPGNYSLEANLWYSNCRALQDPMEATDFHESVKGFVREDHCYVGDVLRRPGLLQVPIPSQPPPRLLHSCSLNSSSGSSSGSSNPSSSSRGSSNPGSSSSGGSRQETANGPTAGRTWRTETYSQRVGGMYMTRPCCRPAALPQTTVPISRLILYGDSTARNQWDLLLALARRPCKLNHPPHAIHDMYQPDSPLFSCTPVSVAEVNPNMDAILKRCSGGLPWTTVPVGTNSIDISMYRPMSYLVDMDNFTYNDTYAWNHQPPVLPPVPRQFTFVYLDGHNCHIPKVIDASVRTGDVLILNMGSHCSRALTFAAWKSIINQTGAMLRDVMIKTGATIIWRTSLPYKEHVFRNSRVPPLNGYFPASHFMTDARRLLFDSYAEHVLIPLGVHIWDVYGTVAMGEHAWNDMVHVDSHTSWAMNEDMMDVFACRG